MANSEPVERRRMTRRAEDYETWWSQLEFDTYQIPEKFNLGRACLDDHDPTARALTAIAPDRTATHYTFADLTTQSNQLANVLTEFGVRRGDVVGVVKRQSKDTAVALMTLFRMGAIAMPLSSLFGLDALAYRIGHSGAKVVLVGASQLEKVRESVESLDGVQVLTFSQELVEGLDVTLNKLMSRADDQFEVADTNAEDPAFLIYTSGTTGDPKGALHSHRVIFGQFPCHEAIYEFLPQEGDAIYSSADWVWIAGLMSVLVVGLYAGITIVVDEEESGFDPVRAVWIMREFAVTLTVLQPTVLRLIKSSPVGEQGGSFALRAMAAGGETFGPELLEWTHEYFGCSINEAYGQTEYQGILGNCAAVFEPRWGSLGKPFPGVRARVVDDEGNRVIGEIGRIVAHRNFPGRMLGYWNDPAATARKYEGEWLVTGDLGYEDESGYFWYASREDDVIKSSGYRIGPGEIEQSLIQHPAVQVSGVVGVPDEMRGQVPKAFIVLQPGYEGSRELADELRRHVAERLARHEVPRLISFQPALPMTTTGKVMRHALRDLE